MSTRIHGDKNWEKIWVSWRWIQDETSDCQKNCSHHRQLYLKDNKTPYTIQLQYEYRVIRKCCILIQIHNKKYMEAIQILADYQCDISMHTISFTFNNTCTRGGFSRAVLTRARLNPLYSQHKFWRALRAPALLNIPLIFLLLTNGLKHV